MELLNIKKIKVKNKIKKSGFEDAFFVIAVIFTVVIFVLVLAKAWGSISPALNEGILSSMPSDTSVNVTTTLNKITSTTNLFDKMLPFLLIGLFGFVLIGASFYMNHPIMIFVGIIILGVAITLAVIYANVYHQISSSDEFSSTNADFSIQEAFMKYLPYLIIIMFIGITAAIIWSRGGASGQL